MMSLIAMPDRPLATTSRTALFKATATGGSLIGLRIIAVLQVREWQSRRRNLIAGMDTRIADVTREPSARQPASMQLSIRQSGKLFVQCRGGVVVGHRLHVVVNPLGHR